MGHHNPSRPKKELFRKRRLALFKKAHEVARSGADVYLVIRRCNNHYSVFNSGDSVDWPPSIETARDESIKYTVSSDFELEDIENLRSTEDSQTARQPQTVKDSQAPKNPQSSPLYLDEPPVGWDTQSTSMIGSQLDYCASSYPKSTGSSYPLSLDDTLISQHSNYKDGSPEQTALAMENLHYPSLVPRIFVFPISRPPILELSPSDVRAAETPTFMYQEHTSCLSMNGQG